MAIVNSASTYNANISNTSHPRDPSFSSYLNSNEETFVLKVSESTEISSAIITATTQVPLYHNILSRKKADGEISVFSAEKYFNSKIEQEEKSRITEKDAMRNHPKQHDRIVIHPIKTSIKPGTPSSCSETSWNSRSALLGCGLREPSPSPQQKANGKSFLATLGCKCSCADKNSVDIDENCKKNVVCGEIHGKMISKAPIEIKPDPVGSVETKQSTMIPQTWFTEETPGKNFENLTSPISNNGVRNLKSQFEGVDQEIARKSIEVFGSPVLEKEDTGLNIERRLNMLSWYANPRVEHIPAVPSLSDTMKIEDNDDSDSSSDLFEIKSLSSNANPFLRCQGSDGISACMSPSTCYEPSEASIDWSVVTASATNFSVASDYDEQKSIASARNHDDLISTRNTNTSAKAEMGKEVPKRRSSMLSGCKSHKAVKIVAEAHRVPQKKSDHRSPRSDAIRTMSRFQAESKVIDFESAHIERAFATRSFSQLHSIRASNSLNMN